MNFKKIIYGLGVATSLFAIQSCDKIKDFKDTNTNPNQTTSPIPSALLTNVESNMGTNLVFDAGGANTGPGLYGQYFSETQYTEVSRYGKPNYNYDAYYVGPLADLQNIINYNSNPATASIAATFGSNKNQIAIARILKAHYMKFLTDVTGDLPYFNILKGQSGVITVPYDPQQTIYADLIKELKEAVDQFDNGTTVQGDIIFSGNTAKWKKYANSLRLLLAINMWKKDPNAGKTEFLAALNHSAGVISDNADNVVINYPGGTFPNPFYNYYNITQRFDFAESKTMTDLLSGDPRLNVYGSSAKGFPYGLTRDNAIAFANANPDWAQILADGYRQSNSPLTILSAGYLYLVRAEAAKNGVTTEVVFDGTAGATGMVDKGIIASFAQWGLSGASTVIGNTGAVLQKIVEQEWIAAYPSGTEAWNIWRRTGFPVLVAAPGLTTPGIPRRAPYGTNDYSYNAGNVGAAAANYTVAGVPDSQWGRIWWDKQ